MQDFGEWIFSRRKDDIKFREFKDWWEMKKEKQYKKREICETGEVGVGGKEEEFGWPLKQCSVSNLGVNRKTSQTL